MPGYYDIDEILAEEELIPCTTQFDYSYLSHLDPEAAAATSSKTQHRHVLPEHSKIKMPIWAMRKWADLGFCRVSLPKHYGIKARDMLGADPAAVMLRPRFFRSGRAVALVLVTAAHKNARTLAAQPASARRTSQLQQLEATLQDARLLRETLLQVGCAFFSCPPKRPLAHFRCDWFSSLRAPSNKTFTTHARGTRQFFSLVAL